MFVKYLINIKKIDNKTFIQPEIVLNIDHASKEDVLLRQLKSALKNGTVLVRCESVSLEHADVKSELSRPGDSRGDSATTLELNNGSHIMHAIVAPVFVTGCVISQQQLVNLRSSL